MRNWTLVEKILVVLIAIGGLLLGASFARAECLPSAKAVHEAHKGTWATWHEVEGKRCWMARSERQERRHARIPTPRERSYARRDTLRDYEGNPPAEWKMAERWTFTTDQPEFERLSWMAGVTP